MKKVLIATLSLCLSHLAALAQSIEEQPATPSGDLDIYLAIGQSNMAGRAEIRAEDQAALDSVYLFSGSVDHTWVAATNPMNRFAAIRKVKEMQRLSPAYSFAAWMKAAHPGQEIGMVVSAKGGSKIVEWLPGTTLYRETLRQANDALQHGKLKGIIWCQGESDSDPLRVGMYLQRLEILVNAFREEFDLPNLPFIVSQLFDRESHKAFNEMIKQVPTFIKHTGLVLGDGLQTTDDLHYDSESILILGSRYADELIRVENEK